MVDRFFAQARAVHFGDRDWIELTSADLQVLVSDDAVLAHFIIRFRREAQNAELRARSSGFEKHCIQICDELAAEMRIDADGVDKYVGRVVVHGATGGGINDRCSRCGYRNEAV